MPRKIKTTTYECPQEKKPTRQEYYEIPGEGLAYAIRYRCMSCGTSYEWKRRVVSAFKVAKNPDVHRDDENSNAVKI